jgi:hypothetical protein
LDVYEAVTSRRAVRGFTDRPVPGEVLQRVMSDVTVHHPRTGRAPLDETATFVDG